MIEDVRHVVPSSRGTRIVLGAFKNDVEVWNLADGRCLAGFGTCFDFGGSRLALSDELNLLIAAAYERYGLVAYVADTGKTAWSRADLKKIQRLSLSADGTLVFCGREGFPLEVVDIASGKTVRRIRATDKVDASPFEPIQLLIRWKPVLQRLDTDTTMSIPIADPSWIRDVVFAEQRVVIARGVGDVLCFSTESARLLWSYSPEPGRFVLKLGYRVEDGMLLGTERFYEKGGRGSPAPALSLVTIEPHSGEVQVRQEMGDEGRCHAFCQQGRTLVAWSRRVISTVTAQPIAVLGGATAVEPPRLV